MQVTIGALGLYLGKVTLLSGLLYAYYHIFLRDKQSFGWNRFYLVSATMLSVFIPLLRIPIHIPAIEYAVSNNTYLLGVLPGHAEDMADSHRVGVIAHPIPWQLIFLSTYGTIALVLAANFFRQLWSISRLFRENKKQQLGDAILIPTDTPGTPFSFFNWIFWDQQLPIQSEAGKQILRHELAHVRYQHSIDKLTFQILCIVLFPVFPLYFIRRELQLVHEYQADHDATGQKDVDVYAGYLLARVFKVPSHVLAHGFHQHPLARRIAMMQFLPSFRPTAWTRWMVLPLFAIAIALCAFTVERTFHYSVANFPSRVMTVVIDAGHGGSDNGAVSGKYREKDINLAIAEKVSALSRDYPVRIVLSRGNDSLVSIDDRIQLAQADHANLFVSIHTNMGPSNTESGIQNYVSARNLFYDSSLVLGSLLAQHLNAVYPTEQVLREQSRGIGVLSRNTCPAVLVECGFITNPKDAAFMSNPADQEKIARQILVSISDYAKGSYPKPLSVQQK